MRKEERFAGAFVVVLALAAVFGHIVVAHGGDLEPSDPPGPTMKTLDEVEPRTLIQESDLPLTITESGSYYLVENIALATANTNAITVAASNVSIDLNGFILTGPNTGASGAAIAADTATRENVTVANGSITQFVIGIQLPGKGSRISNVAATGNLNTGIYTGDSSLIEKCVASANPSIGIKVGTDSIVRDSIARSNSYEFMGMKMGTGIEAGASCTISRCTVYDNGSLGITASSNATIEGCTARNTGSVGILAGVISTVRGCTAVGSNYYNGVIYTGDGIRVGDGSSVTSCAAYNNRLNGILASRGCVITDCSVRDNLSTGIAAGRSRISNNTVTGNDVRGIFVDFGCSIYGNNVAENNIGVAVNNTGNIIRDNNFFQNTVDGLNVADASNYSAQNTFHNNGTNINGAHQQGTGDMQNIIIP
jgi:parallel beta-helix repeat protein